MRDKGWVRCGAETAEKLAIRKCFLICCEWVRRIFNILTTTDQNCALRAGTARARDHAARRQLHVSARHLGCRDPAPGDAIAKCASARPASQAPRPCHSLHVASSAAPQSASTHANTFLIG